MKRLIPVFLSVASFLVCAVVSADQAACDTIRAAYEKTGNPNVKMTKTGYDFAKDTRKIYTFGTQTCEHVRDEIFDGQPVTVYREQYRSDSGSTDAMLWISKSSGRLLKEEQDGNIVGKGKGHISYRWPSA